MENKKLVIILSIIGVIAFLFWTSSRYPQLNEKANMGDDTPSMGISFDVIKEINEKDNVLTKIFYHTLNWIDTNKKGMTFGLLFAAALILLFSLISEKQFKNRWLNSFIGMLLGAPLGVCVNCAAPIAQGINDSGGRTETALATMISSPTLNIIVLSMLFSLFPAYMIITKLGLSIFFILIIIPSLTYFFPVISIASQQEITDKTLPASKYTFQPQFVKPLNNQWLTALLWTGTNYFKSLWHIIKTAVPLMLLAGLFGNIVITLVPLESLAYYIPTGGILITLITVLLVATLGTFLPVPMAFDVIIVAILINSSLPILYTMTLLFTLGIFSIYSFMIVYKSISKKLAVSMYASIVLLGAMSGGIMQWWEDNYIEPEQINAYKNLKKSTLDKIWSIQNKSSSEISINNDNLNKFIQSTLVFNPELEQDNISIQSYPFNKSSNGKSIFKKYECADIGINIPFNYSTNHFAMHTSNQRAVTTGDIHQDGYPDIILCSADSIFLFSNINGEKFVRQWIPHPANKIFNVALVDMNNDGWLDIFTCSFKYGNHLMINQKGSFNKENIIKLPSEEKTIFTYAPAFGDIDKDGTLDIFLGNWFSEIMSYSFHESHNYGFYNAFPDWKKFDLNNLNGETLTTLISDINMDGNPDIIEGNDFVVSDFYHLGNGKKEFERVLNQDNMIEAVSQFTMSVSSGDLNNDLFPEILHIQLDGLRSRVTFDKEIICQDIENESNKTNCFEIFDHWLKIHEVRVQKDFDLCPPQDKEGCVAFNLYKENQNTVEVDLEKNEDVEDEWYKNLPNTFPTLRRNASSRFITDAKLISPTDSTDWIPQKRRGPSLLSFRENKYYDISKKFNIKQAGWAWNSKFADLNNDTWLDTYVANGSLGQPRGRSYPNLLFINKNGEKFIEDGEKYGLDNYMPCTSYSYFDYDLDGDLDILLTPEVGPSFLYVNNTQKNSIIFEIKDEIGNSHGIGTKLFIYYGNQKHQYREILSSGGFKSFDEPIAHFGLGDFNKIDKLEIHWSTGEKNIINQSFEAGKRYRLIRK